MNYKKFLSTIKFFSLALVTTAFAACSNTEDADGQDGASVYDMWMGTGNYYLGSYNWTKVESNEL